MSIVRDRNRRGKRRTDNKIDVVCHRICHYAVADVRQGHGKRFANVRLDEEDCPDTHSATMAYVISHEDAPIENTTSIVNSVSKRMAGLVK